MNHCDPRFRPLLAGLNAQELEEHDGTIYGLWSDLTLAGWNRRWREFAEQNGGAKTLEAFDLGSYVPGAISPPLRGFYRSAFERCLVDREPWEHRYECSNALRRRTMHMRAQPLGQSEGLLVIHRCVLDVPQEHTPMPTVESLYLDVNGRYRQCSHCRRTQQARAPRVWDWVPQWVDAAPANTSYVICPLCFDHYHPEPLGQPSLIESTVPGGLFAGVS